MRRQKQIQSTQETKPPENNMNKIPPMKL